MGNPDAQVGSDLAWLLSPTPMFEFWGESWGKRPVLVQRGIPEYFQQLPSLTQVDEILTTTLSAASSIDGKLLRAGHGEGFDELRFEFRADGSIDIQNIYQKYSDGYTVVLNQLEKKSASIARICNKLEEELGARIGANFYLTPPNAQGFCAHFDSHDVLIAQIAGAKTWLVGRLPYEGESGTGLARPGFRENAHEWTLRSGDAMYLPRACAHQAVTRSQSSLHITFGVARPSWDDLGTNAPISGRTDDGSVLDGLRRSLATCRKIEDAMEDFEWSGYLQNFIERPTARSGQFLSIDSLQDLGDATELTRATPGLTQVFGRSGRLFLQFPGGTVDVTDYPLKALQYLEQNSSLRLSELPGFGTRESQRRCAAQLVSAGYLQVVGAEGSREKYGV